MGACWGRGEYVNQMAVLLFFSRRSWLFIESEWQGRGSGTVANERGCLRRGGLVHPGATKKQLKERPCPHWIPLSATCNFVGLEVQRTFLPSHSRLRSLHSTSTTSSFLRYQTLIQSTRRPQQCYCIPNNHHAFLRHPHCPFGRHGRGPIKQ